MMPRPVLASLLSARGVLATFVPPAVQQQSNRLLLLRSAQRRNFLSSRAIYAATAQRHVTIGKNGDNVPKLSETDSTPLKKKGRPRRNNLPMINQQSRSLFLFATATSNRLGTGVGVSLVLDPLVADSDNDATAAAAAGAAVVGTPSFGVYFHQHRSLYEREYTALIVALQWLQQQNRPTVNGAKQPPEIITLLIREDVVYHQLLGDYPVEKESLLALHRVAIELIQDLPVRLELCSKADAFRQCRHLASRALLMERSDTGFASFIDPLDPYSLPISEEEESMEAEYLSALEEFYGDVIVPKVGSFNHRETTSLDFGKEPDGLPETNLVKALAQPQDQSTGNLKIDGNRKYLLQFDGGARGNPNGPSACGMVLYDDERKQIWCGAKYLGEHMTNNQAEYTGIVLGLQTAIALGIRKLQCQGDSELIIKQLNGQYKVKNEGLKPLYRAATEAIGRFDFFEAGHIFREDNTVADYLTNQAMDKKKSIGF